MELITAWMDQYGYIVLFIVLMLEPLGFPFSSEFLMGYCGILASTGQLSLTSSFIIAASGCLIGRTVSFWLGYKLGVPFFQKKRPPFPHGAGKDGQNRLVVSEIWKLGIGYWIFYTRRQAH